MWAYRRGIIGNEGGDRGNNGSLCPDMTAIARKMSCVRQPLNILLSFSVLLMLQACGNPSTSEKPADTSRKTKIEQDMSKFEDGLRIAAANKRIDELDRKVAELEAAPEKLDLDVLSRRVSTLELKANADAAFVAVAPSSENRMGVYHSDRNAIRPDTNARQLPKRPPSLKLPDLETRPRLATPAEAKAFTPNK